MLYWMQGWVQLLFVQSRMFGKQQVRFWIIRVRISRASFNYGLNQLGAELDDYCYNC